MDEIKDRLLRTLSGKGAHMCFEEAVTDFPEDMIKVKLSIIMFKY